MRHERQIAREEDGSVPGSQRPGMTDRAIQADRARLVESAGASPDIDASFVAQLLAAGPWIASPPVDFARHDPIMSRAPVPEETLVEIVDRVFLPLVLAGRPQQRGRA